MIWHADILELINKTIKIYYIEFVKHELDKFKDTLPDFDNNLIIKRTSNLLNPSLKPIGIQRISDSTRNKGWTKNS